LSTSTCKSETKLPNYFHPKATVLVARGLEAGFIYLQGIHRSPQKDITKQAAVRTTATPPSAQRLEVKAPTTKYCNIPTKITTTDLHLCTPLALTRRRKEKKVPTFKLSYLWVPIHPHCGQDRDRSTHWEAVTGSLTHSCQY
jgi:hypothetical protein